MVLHFSPRLADEVMVEIILRKRWRLIAYFLTVALPPAVGVFRKHSGKKWMYFVFVCGGDFSFLRR